MRKSVILAWAAATALSAGVASAADSPVSVPQLAPGEVLLQVNGLGNVRTPATLATVTGSAEAYGATEGEARQALQAKIRDMTAAARAAGASADDIRVSAESVSEMVRDLDVIADEQSTSSEARRFFARATVTVRLRDVRGAQGLHARFSGFSAMPRYYGGAPVYELVDETAPRRAARAQAIANARADAESYAAAMNMRIVRILQVTERGGLDFLSMTVSESNAMIRAFRSFSSAEAEAQVETYAVVGVDFVLVPR